jgi:hypothetical protein
MQERRHAATRKQASVAYVLESLNEGARPSTRKINAPMIGQDLAFLAKSTWAGISSTGPAALGVGGIDPCEGGPFSVQRKSEILTVCLRGRPANHLCVISDIPSVPHPEVQFCSVRALLVKQMMTSASSAADSETFTGPRSSTPPTLLRPSPPPHLAAAIVIGTDVPCY